MGGLKFRSHRFAALSGPCLSVGQTKQSCLGLGPKRYALFEESRCIDKDQRSSALSGVSGPLSRMLPSLQTTSRDFAENVRTFTTNGQRPPYNSLTHLIQPQQGFALADVAQGIELA